MCKAPVFFLAFCNGTREQIAGLNQYASQRLAPSAFAILGPRKRDELLAAAWEADIGIVDYSPSVEDTNNQRYCAPTKLYEFMALGLAIVGSDNDSLRDIIVMEDIGECAEDGSSNALSAALERAVHDPDRLRSMKERATRCFHSRHSYEALCLPAVQQISRALERNSDS
jgi:glycosyltransferase involved in cell wall biosynthesis